MVTHIGLATQTNIIGNLNKVLMENLLIFGDSFADPMPIKDRHLFLYTWPNKLSKKFITQNFAVSGTGPDFSLQKFLAVDKDINKKDNTLIIFCISSISRFNFKFFEPKDQILINHLLQSSMPTKLQDIANKYFEFKPFIEKFFKQYIYHSTYLETEITKLLLILKYLTRNYKKTIVLPCFDNISPDLLNYTNSDNFFVYKNALMQYNRIDIEVDYRPNHMDEDHHKKFYDYILTLLRSNNE